tara:strand:- start:39 stop:230 length:192 start_codon:yes stop_codon:yes gene_type:complete
MPGKKKTLLGNPILPLPAESKGTLPDGFFKNLKGTFGPLPGAASEKKKYGGMMKKKKKDKKKK